MINQYIKNLPKCPDFDKSSDFLNAEDYYDYLNSFSKMVSPKKVLEIGVRYGYSGIAFCKDVESVERYVGLDYDLYDSKSSAYAEENIAFLMTSKNNFSYDLKKINTQYLTSLDFLNDETFDLIHVDGDHSFRGAIRDIANFWNVLNIGGYMLIDDSFFYPTVRKAIEKMLPVLDEPNYEIKSLRGTWVIKKTTELKFNIMTSDINEMGRN